MKIFKKLIHCLIDCIEILKGSKSLKFIKSNQSIDDGYRITTSHNYDIAIFCKESIYFRNYTSKWVSSKTIAVYHVYCICSDNTPDNIKEIFKEELRIGCVLSPWASRDSQKKEIINVFVELAINAATINRVNIKA